MHLHGPGDLAADRRRGRDRQMMQGNGYGFNWKGLYVTSLIDFHAGWRERADELSDTLKITMLLGQYMIKQLSRPLLRQGAEPRAPARAPPTTRCSQTTTCC